MLAGDAAIAPNHDTNREKGRYAFFFLQVKTLVLLNQNMQDGRSVRTEREAEEKIIQLKRQQWRVAEKTSERGRGWNHVFHAPCHDVSNTWVASWKLLVENLPVLLSSLERLLISIQKDRPLSISSTNR